MLKRPSPIHILLCLLLLPFAIQCQSNKIDSLTNLLAKVKQDTEKVNILNKLSLEYENIGNYNSSDSLAHKALTLGEQTGFKSGQAYAFRQIASVCDDRGNYSASLENFNKTLNIRKELNDKQGIAYTLNRIGLVYSDESEYFKALEYYQESLQTYLEINFKQGIADVHDNIGHVYDAQGNYPKAIEELFEARKAQEDIGNKKGLASVYEDLGNVYNEQNDLKKALEEQENSLKLREDLHDNANIANSLSNMGLIYVEMGKDSLALVYDNKGLIIRKEIGAKEGIAISVLNIGGIYLDQKKYDIALDNFNNSLDIFKGLGNKTGIANCFDGIAKVYMAQKKYDDALKFEKQSLDLFGEIGSQEGVETSDLTLSTIYDMMGNEKEAFSNYKKYISARDSIFNKENTQKSTQTEMNYQFEKKQAEAKAEQNKKDAIAAADKRRQQIITWSVSGGLLLVVVFSGLLFSRFRLIQKQKSIIESQKEEVEKKNIVIEEKNKDIIDSINYAKRLQDAILPPLSIIKKYVPDSFVLYKPKDIVAGDFYWLERAGGSVLIAACDCTGHGVPGAMVSVVCSNALNRTVKEFHITEPGKILDKVRELVIETFSQRDPLGEKSESEVQDGMDMSLASLTPTEGGTKVQWSGAFNSLWYVQDNVMKEITADKQPIGRTDNPKPFNTHSFTLPHSQGDQGSLLYLFTDGYADQFGGPKGKKFKYKQLEEKLLSLAKMSMDTQKKMLDEAIESWKGNLEQVDDILIIGIRV